MFIDNGDNILLCLNDCRESIIKLMHPKYNYLLTSKVVAEQPVIQPQLNYADYTNEVEELIPSREISKVLNPIYQVADYYNPLLNLTTNYTRNDVKLVVDRSKLKTAYQLVEPDSCFEVS
ncbi:unnamed protein product [Trichobilharzia regenti]|nr:unnamed protein product [Trichobilharzia regenti]